MSCRHFCGRQGFTNDPDIYSLPPPLPPPWSYTERLHQKLPIRGEGAGRKGYLPLLDSSATNLSLTPPDLPMPTSTTVVPKGFGSNDFMTQKVYFSRLMRVCVGFSNVSGVYLTQVSLLLIGQQCLEDFFRYRPLLPIGSRIVQIVRQPRRKTKNTVPDTLSAMLAASQSIFINEHLYSTCD
jgi:hypothetical protein